MITISAIILADNREDIIENCLKTLFWVDEIILINLGAKDKTISIAKKYNCRIVKGLPEYNFSAWRNQGAQVAKGKWLLYIDADERITPELQHEIQTTLKPSDNNHETLANAFYLPRKNYFLGKEFKTAWPDFQLRLIKKDKLIKWYGNIHELPEINGKTTKLNNFIIHLSHRSLETSMINTLKWSKLEADNRFKLKHPIMTSWRFLRIFVTSFWHEFVTKQLWKDGVEGAIEGLYQVLSLYITYVRLWEKQRQETLKETYDKIDEDIIRSFKKS